GLLNKQPTDPTLRHEGSDIIKGQGAVLVWSNNRGTSLTQDGPAVDPSLRPENMIFVGSGQSTVFGTVIDTLKGNANGTVNVNALGQTVLLTKNSIQSPGSAAVPLPSIEHVKISNTNGGVIIQGDDADNSLRLFGNTNSLDYSLDLAPLVTILGVTSLT